MNIRWGKTISSFTSFKEISAGGFDRIQPTIYYLMSLSDEQFIQAKELISRSSLIPEVCSSPLPPDAHVTQMGFNIYVWSEYLKKAVQRAAELGCRKIVWNDGRTRILPIEGNTRGAKEQVLQFLYMLCEIAGNYNITVLVEPLGPMRTNFLNSMQEVKDFLPLVGKDNISSLISLRELSEIDLEITDLRHYADLISHIQIENPNEKIKSKKPPRRNDNYDYSVFLRSVVQIGYADVINLPEDTDTESLNYMRNLLDSLQ